MKSRHSRNGGRDRQRRFVMMALSLSVVMVLMSLCVVDFSGENVHTSQFKTKASQCESTCNTRIHKAALESSSNYSASPNKFSPNPTTAFPSMDVSPLTLNRPKRLPTLIKILTGFHENYAHIQPSNHYNISRKGSIIIAHHPKPQFPKPTNSIQQIATSAAHSVWKQRQSYYIIKVGCMKTVNREWEEALRWIASWDEAVLQQQQGMDIGLQGLGKEEPQDSSVLGKKGEDYTEFVNDLARLLQNCIDTCLKDEDLEVWIEENNGDDGTTLESGSFVGKLIAPSLFKWVSFSSPFRISSEKGGLLNPSTKLIFSGLIQIIASSVALYAVHYLWSGTSLLTCESSDDTWLIEHEKEVEMAKKSRQRKGSSKKAKKKASGNKSSQPTGKLKSIAVEHKVKCPQPPARNKPSNLVNTPTESRTNERQDIGSNNCWESHQCHQSHIRDTEEHAMHPSSSENSHNVQHDIAEDLGDVPSSISISTSSYNTMSNTEHVEDQRNLSHSSSADDPPAKPTAPTLNQLPYHQQLNMNSPPNKPLLVPTQQQRNEAAQRLRDFQNAQIQRLVYRKNLAQRLKGSSSPGTMPSVAVQSTPTGSFNSPATKPLKPPPGFGFSLDIQYQDTLEDDFFADNELLLSKLLDDDDDSIHENLSTDSGINSFPHESSLDPSAAPFVLEGFDSEKAVSSSDAKNDASKWKNNCSPSHSMNEKSPAVVKGVYGGGLW